MGAASLARAGAQGLPVSIADRVTDPSVYGTRDLSLHVPEKSDEEWPVSGYVAQPYSPSSLPKSLTRHGKSPLRPGVTEAEDDNLQQIAQGFSGDTAGLGAPRNQGLQSLLVENSANERKGGGGSRSGQGDDGGQQTPSAIPAASADNRQGDGLPASSVPGGVCGPTGLNGRGSQSRPLSGLAGLGPASKVFKRSNSDPGSSGAAAAGTIGNMYMSGEFGLGAVPHNREELTAELKKFSEFLGNKIGKINKLYAAPSSVVDGVASKLPGLSNISVPSGVKKLGLHIKDDAAFVVAGKNGVTARLSREATNDVDVAKSELVKLALLAKTLEPEGEVAKLHAEVMAGEITVRQYVKRRLEIRYDALSQLSEFEEVHSDRDAYVDRHMPKEGELAGSHITNFYTMSYLKIMKSLSRNDESAYEELQKLEKEGKNEWKKKKKEAEGKDVDAVVNKLSFSDVSNDAEIKKLLKKELLKEEMLKKTLEKFTQEGGSVKILHAEQGKQEGYAFDDNGNLNITVSSNGGDAVSHLKQAANFLTKVQPVKDGLKKDFGAYDTKVMYDPNSELSSVAEKGKRGIGEEDTLDLWPLVKKEDFSYVLHKPKNFSNSSSPDSPSGLIKVYVHAKEDAIADKLVSSIISDISNDIKKSAKSVGA